MRTRCRAAVRLVQSQQKVKGFTIWPQEITGVEEVPVQPLMALPSASVQGTAPTSQDLLKAAHSTKQG